MGKGTWIFGIGRSVDSGERTFVRGFADGENDEESFESGSAGCGGRTTAAYGEDAIQGESGTAHGAGEFSGGCAD